jgi:hypothetical protein
MLLGLDDLRLLEDVLAVGEALERLIHLLGLDGLGFLEDVLAVGEALERLVHLLGLDGAEDEVRKLAGALVVTSAVALRADLLGLRGGEHRTQFSSDTLLGW